MQQEIENPATVRPEFAELQKHASQAEPAYVGLRWCFRGIATVLVLIQIVLVRNTFGPDPRSYMVIARAILRHDWAMTVNAYWSALYPWLLAAMLAIFRPSLRWEFPVAHALAFPVFLACMAAFEFFWVSLLRLRQVNTATLGLVKPPIPTGQMWVLGYSIFIWYSVGVLASLITPDACVATIALLAAGVLIQIAMAADAPPRLYVLFGSILGLGYLTKAILFPTAFVFMAAAVLVSKPTFRRRALLALLLFAAIATPEIALLSHAKGRLTYSDAGTINLAWYNLHIPDRNWHGDPPGSGTPVHPTRIVYDHPTVYEFNPPVPSTYPPWDDPSYWNEGLAPKFRFAAVARHAADDAFQLAAFLLHPYAWAIGILIFLLGCDPKETSKAIAANWFLIAISAAVFGFYCFTLILGRFFPAWQIMLWGAVLAGVRLRPRAASLAFWLTGLVCFALVLSMVHLVYGESVDGAYNDARVEYTTAEGLIQMGLRPGDKVVAIGFDNDAHWAYLAHLDIVAEINTDDTCQFWSQPSAVQTRILQLFAQTGARAVIANTGDAVKNTSRDVPLELAACARPRDEWRKIPGGRDHVFFLK